MSTTMNAANNELTLTVPSEELSAARVALNELLAAIPAHGYELSKDYSFTVADVFVTGAQEAIYLLCNGVRVMEVTGGSTEVRMARLLSAGYLYEQTATGQTLREAQEELSTQLSCNAMSEDEAICIQFFGLYGVWFWVATDKFASYEGDMHEMLTDNGVSEANANHILNRDWAYADYQGAATRQCASEWSFDWELYNAIQESDMELEPILAGLAMGLTVEDIEDKYHGHFETEEDLAYEYIESTGMLAEAPDSLKSYFDYERFGRDLAMDFSVQDNHYFSH